MNSGDQLYKAFDAVSVEAATDPVLGPLLKKHEEKFKKLGSTLGQIFGLCLGDMVASGFTPDEIAELVIVTLNRIK